MKQKTLNLAIFMMLTIGLNFVNAQSSLYVWDNLNQSAETYANDYITHSDLATLVIDFYHASPGSFNLKRKTDARGSSFASNTIASPFGKLAFEPGTTGPDPEPAVCQNNNPDFSSGLTNWDNWTNTGTTATFAEVSGEYAITNIVGATARWHAQISQNFNFVNGTPYTITFDARSTTDKPIGVLIRECVTGDCGTADTYQNFTVTSAPQTFTFDYTQNEPSYVYGQIIFEAAENTSDIFFDNICISEKTFSAPEVTASNKTFRIYPNPVSSVFNIDAPEAGTISIISLQGKVLLTKSVNANTDTVNIENLNSGVYLCKYTSSKETKTTKLVKL